MLPLLAPGRGDDEGAALAKVIRRDDGGNDSSLSRLVRRWRGARTIDRDTGRDTDLGGSLRAAWG